MLAGAEFEGRRHDALFDARNTARIFRTVRIPEERKRSLGKVIEVLNTHTTSGSCLGEMFDFSKMIAVA
jgi:inhibitor of KinA sporulation pathway (predicted exonuclease)